MDAAYGAYAAAENSTFDSINNRYNTANNNANDDVCGGPSCTNFRQRNT